MSIEIYTTVIIWLYTGLFLLSIPAGAVEIWNRIRKKTSNYWRGIIPCSILYLISALLSTFAASIAYDDPSDPNYARYENWKLHDFILHDIRTLIIWLCIGMLLYLISKRLSGKRSIISGSVKTGFTIICLLLFMILIILSVVKA